MLRQISQAPRVYCADEFVSPGEIARALTRHDGPSGAAAIGQGWSRGVAGLSAELPLGQDPLLATLASRIAGALGFDGDLPDPTFRFRRYAVGDHHPAHLDCYEIEGRHLVATALLYLTDALVGGETVFPDAEGGPLSISARAGRLAAWFNYTPDGAVDPRSRHLSRALRMGEKATLAYFIYAPLARAAARPAVEPAALVAA